MTTQHASSKNPLTPLQAVSILTVAGQHLDAKDRDFAESLVNQFSNGKRLSEKQVYWLGRMARKALGQDEAGQSKGDKPKTTPAGPVIGLKSIVDRLKQASLKVKHPDIVLSLGDVQVRFALASDWAKYPGAVHIAAESKGGDYFGRITPAGELTLSEKVASHPLVPALIELTKSLAADPVEVAKQHGALTGKCCFCNSKLTDGKSIAVGYGPVCAQRFGMLWGELKAPAF